VGGCQKRPGNSSPRKKTAQKKKKRETAVAGKRRLRDSRKFNDEKRRGGAGTVHKRKPRKELYPKREGKARSLMALKTTT